MALQPQHVLAAVFFSLGGWALLAPAHVLDTVLLEPVINDLTTLLVAVVGSQAAMTGTLFLTARMTRDLYMSFAVGMIPFLVLFNYRYMYVKPIFNQWLWLDVAGTVVILLTCLWGIRTLQAPAGRGAAARKAR